ncbi:HK97-gp10 family putative phage morphogenesis protein [Microbulbifer sp. HZ11]|uniref:HK97-gp10 family putative phage morphogenesis protein n=1 Tax=Microbulbifer sp. HZ11 TaxID=1453501 RepID=UPI0005B7D2F1|nr:HK97-gp10 family putative phage morphogenesis protein [Microbulbifer sp. HZ11]
MSDGSKFNVEGLGKLNRALLGLDAKTGSAVLRRAGRQAMKRVETAMRNGAKVDSGDLQDSIGMRASTAKGKSRDRVARITVGPLKKSKGRGDNKRDLHNTNQKAIAQEYGNAKQSAKPFIRPALENNIDSVLRDVINEVSNELTKLK